MDENYTASANDILNLLRVKAQTNELLQSQIESAFWEAVAKQPPPDNDQSNRDSPDPNEPETEETDE